MKEKNKDIIVRISVIIIILFILYIFIVGLFIPPPPPETYRFSIFEKIDNISWRINVVGGSKPETPLNETKCVMEYDNSTDTSQVISGNLFIINFTNNILRISFNDSQNDNLISGNDYFLFIFDKIPQFTIPKSFKFHLIYSPTGGEIEERELIINPSL